MWLAYENLKMISWVKALYIYISFFHASCFGSDKKGGFVEEKQLVFHNCDWYIISLAEILKVELNATTSFKCFFLS